MREIKFRAWNPHKKVMSYNFEEINITGHDIVGEVSNGSIKATYQDSTSWKDAPLMQYIGLEDKNGKDIYEGDVVHCAILNADGSGFIRDFTATVEEDICNPCFVLKQENGRVEYDFVMCGLMIIEVIGNIYEHPHLLTKEETK